ncbi:hypothetical protein RIF23_20605, partial [Lipingzhangella sp. LS1_29]
MDILFSVLLFLHLLGMAGILSGWLMQLISGHAKSPKVLLHSTILQVVTGLALVTFLEMGLVDADPDHMKVTAKTVVGVAILVLAILNMRKPSLRLANIAGILGILNVAVAVF